MATNYLGSATRRVLLCVCVLLLPALPALAQPGGFVYALQSNPAAPNQIYGFSVNPGTGVLTALPGFPVFAEGTGTGATLAEPLVYDRATSRLFALNDGSRTVGAFAVNRLTGALTPLPFSPLGLPAGFYPCIAVSPDGGVLVAGDASFASGKVASYVVTASTAVAAPGSPVSTAGADPFSCAFSRDGAYFHTGGGGGGGRLLASFAVNAVTGALTLTGAPLDLISGTPSAMATDSLGRIFSANNSNLRAFTTSAGVPSQVSGNPFGLSGLTFPSRAVIARASLYLVAGRAGQVGAYRISGTGSATILTAAAGSPFASGGTTTNTVALDHTETLLFAGNADSRNITTFRVATTGPTLTSISVQPVNTIGSAGKVNGLAYAPPGIDGFVYALRNINGGTNQLYGFSENAATGVLTMLSGFPLALGAGTNLDFLQEGLVYDGLNARLYALNPGNATISAFAVNRTTGAVAPMPFSPIALPAGSNWDCLAVSPDGSTLAAGRWSPPAVATYHVTATTATAAPGSPASAGGAATLSCVFSRDGHYIYAGGNFSNVNLIAGFAVTAATGALTPLAGSPFDSGLDAPRGYATDTAGRFFVSHSGRGKAAVFTTSAGVPTPVSGSPFDSGLGNTSQSVLTPSGQYLVSNFSGTARVASLQVGGSGSGTTLTHAPGSPFTLAANGAAGIALDDTGTLVFVDNAGTNNIATLRLNPATGSLTSLAIQPAGTLGTTLSPGGVVFVPVATSERITETASGAGPRGITLGPDGNVWFTETGALKIGRVTPAGVVTEFGPTSGYPDGIAPGPDGNLWYAAYAGDKIGRITPSGTITEFPVPAGTGPATIVTGPDGNLWFTAYNSDGIGRMTTTGAVTMFTTGITLHGQPFGIVAGPDGNLWFTEFSGNKIGRITPAGVVTEFPIPTASARSPAITVGPDGALWFTETLGLKIGRITTAGAITEFGGLTSQPGGITVGPDGNLWFSSAAKVGRITPSGVVTEFTPATSPYADTTFPDFITAGADGNIWFAMGSANKVGVFQLGLGMLSIVKSGSGAGTVTGPGLACGAVCASNLPTGTVVTLTATPAAGSRFAGWSGGGCVGTGSCLATVGHTTVVTATFARQFTLTVIKTGTGSVTGSGISCGATCSALQDTGTVVTLTATGGAGLLAKWTSPCGSSQVCSFVITGDRTITVPFGFTLAPATLPPAVVGNPYNQVLTPSGGTAPFLFGPTFGNPPAGITMSNAGVVSGTPTSPSPAENFGVAVTDAAGNTGSGAYSLAILGQPTVSLSSSTVNFGAVNNGAGTWTVQTPAQVLALTQNGPGTVTWTAAADKPWITVSPASGAGPANITVGVTSAGGLPTAGLLSGAVTITTTGASNSPTATVNLTILFGASTPAVGLIDTPTNGQAGITGSLPVTGWAIDDIGVSAVRLCRVAVAGEGPGPDGRCGGQAQVYLGDVVLVSGARPDIASGNPLKPFHERAGWGYLLLTNFLPAQGNGTFTLTVYAEDYDGHSTLLGSRVITCTNASATTPLGAIDTPAQGGTVSGAAFVNFGWALTPQPKMIPIDGSTIRPFIDSLPAGTVTYNFPRADIQALFPGYANTDGAVGFSVIDTTTLTNGVHTISWVVTDNQGAASGIGSRYFTVSNGIGGGSVVASPGMQGASAILGSISALAGIEPSPSAVTIARGFSEGARARIVDAGGGGMRTVVVAPLGRIVLDLDPARDGASYRGYEIQGDELRALPVGAQLEEATGRFVWAPGLAVSGTRHLAFVRSIAGRDEVIRVDVVVDAAVERR